MDNYESKYNDIINRLRKAKEDDSVNDDRYCCVIDDIVPELKESEDDWIRKRLIAMCKHYIECYALDPYNIDDYKEALAWLEKQNEQKPVFEMKTPEESLGIDSETYNKIVDECIYGEQKLANKIEPKDYSSIDPHFFKTANKVEPKFKIGDNIEPIDSCLGSPLTIYKICDGFYKTNQGTLDFEFENNWRLVEQKPATWGEEDESMLNFVKVVLNKHKNDAFFDKFETTLNDCLTWFRNIKSRVGCEVNCTTKQQWKPSDEQMRVLDLAIKCGINRGTTEGTILVSLFDDLKKLKD